MPTKRSMRNIVTTIAVILSSLLQCFAIQTFVRPAELLSSGFTGVALLLNMLTEHSAIVIDTSFAILALNIPVALLCYKSISPRFTIFSCMQFMLTSLFLKVFSFTPIFNDVVLNVAFGGVIYGASVVIALKGNASTGGTDFIALYFSNKYNKSLWQYVFIFNTCILFIFGLSKGWTQAAYSIIFQFLSTKTIETFHTRYDRLTLQITSTHANEILYAYTSIYHHGISCMEGYGGYSRMPMTIMTTVVSSYEVNDIVALMKEIDPHVIINIVRTENFIGGFKPLKID